MTDIWNSATPEEAWACVALVLLAAAIIGVVWFVTRDRNT